MNKYTKQEREKIAETIYSLMQAKLNEWKEDGVFVSYSKDDFLSEFEDWYDDYVESIDSFFEDVALSAERGTLSESVLSFLDNFDKEYSLPVLLDRLGLSGFVYTSEEEMKTSPHELVIHLEGNFARFFYKENNILFFLDSWDEGYLNYHGPEHFEEFCKDVFSDTTAAKKCPSFCGYDVCGIDNGAAVKFEFDDGDVLYGTFQREREVGNYTLKDAYGVFNGRPYVNETVYIDHFDFGHIKSLDACRLSENAKEKYCNVLREYKTERLKDVFPKFYALLENPSSYPDGTIYQDCPYEELYSGLCDLKYVAFNEILKHMEDCVKRNILSYALMQDIEKFFGYQSVPYIDKEEEEWRNLCD